MQVKVTKNLHIYKCNEMIGWLVLLDLWDNHVCVCVCVHVEMHMLLLKSNRYNNIYKQRN